MPSQRKPSQSVFNLRAALGVGNKTQTGGRGNGAAALRIQKYNNRTDRDNVDRIKKKKTKNIPLARWGPVYAVQTHPSQPRADRRGSGKHLSALHAYEDQVDQVIHSVMWDKSFLFAERGRSVIVFRISVPVGSGRCSFVISIVVWYYW